MKKLTTTATMLSIAMTTGAMAEPEKFNMATPWPGGQIMKSANRFADRVKLFTNGEVEIEVHVGGQLGGALKVTDTVRNGVAEAGHTWMGYDWGVDRTTVLFAGWAGSPKTDVFGAWLTEGGGAELQAQFRDEEFDVVSINCGLGSPEVGMVSNKKIQSIEDFKGLKLRTSGAWAEIAVGLGASTVTVPGGETFEALERGLIDALEWGSLGTNRNAGFHDIAKYSIFPGIHQPTVIYECLFNKDAWERIGERNQQMIAAAAEVEMYVNYTERGHEDAEAYQFLKENGHKFIVLDDEVLVEAARLSAEWADKVAADNPWFAKVLESQRAYEALWENSENYR